jgi:DNA-binding NarL/FixJ family response regulator
MEGMKRRKKLDRFGNAIPGKSEIQLSQRDIEMLTCIANGLSTKEIAYELGISKGTIANRLAYFYDNFWLSRRAELVSWIVQHERAMLGKWTDPQHYPLYPNAAEPAVVKALPIKTPAA